MERDRGVRGCGSDAHASIARLHPAGGDLESGSAEQGRGGQQRSVAEAAAGGLAFRTQIRGCAGARGPGEGERHSIAADPVEEYGELE
jgi:hypothetical protein